MSEIKTLSKDEINALPIKRYEGPVVLVESTAQVEQALADFAGERLVGFDTETRPTFKVGQKHPVALTQVATARAVYLFQLQRIDHAPVLRPLLQSKSTKAGVGIGDDLKALRELFPFEPDGIASSSPSSPMGSRISARSRGRKATSARGCARSRRCSWVSGFRKVRRPPIGRHRASPRSRLPMRLRMRGRAASSICASNRSE